MMKHSLFLCERNFLHFDKLELLLRQLIRRSWKESLNVAHFFYVINNLSAMNCVSPGGFLTASRTGPKCSLFILLLFLSQLHNATSASNESSNKESNGVGSGSVKPSLLCPPLVCICTDVDMSANCSHRGFLSTPPALPSSIRHLDLSYNDLETVNASEILRITQLESLDLR